MGGNLVRKPNQVLINTLSANDVTYSGGILRMRAYGNDITIANVESFTKIENSAGTLKVSQMAVRPVYPTVVAGGWEGGIEVKKTYQLTGDPQDFYGLSKPATHKITNFRAADSGYLNALDCVEIAGELTEQINGDINSIVTAECKVYVDWTASGTIAITDLSGNVILASQTVATVAALVVLGDASSDFSVVADGSTGAYISASEGMIITGESAKWDVTLSYVVYTQVSLTKPFTLLGHNIGVISVETVNTAFVKEVLPITEVQRAFPILPGQIAGVPNVPIAGTAYTKCIFKIIHTDAPGMVAGNRRETVYEDLHVYLPTSVAEGSLWSDIFYAYLPSTAWTVPTFGALTYDNTGTSGSGAGTMSVVDQPGFVVSSVQYYAGFGNSGTIDESTGVIATGTDDDTFFAEINYAHLDYLVISQMTITTFTTATTYTGAILTAVLALESERMGVFDVTVDGSGIGTPVLRNFYDHVIESQLWAYSGTLVCSVYNGTITTGAANTDNQTLTVTFVGSTTVHIPVHQWVTGALISQTVGPAIPTV